MMEIVKPPVEYADKFELGALAGAVKSVAGVRGCAAIVHGIQGCAIAASHVRSGGPTVSGNYMPLIETNLNPGEIVKGRNEELIAKQVRQLVQRKHGEVKLLFILTGDATSIIEDDVRGVAYNLSSELGIPIIGLDTSSGFLGGFSRGAEQTWCAVLDHFGSNSGERRGINLVGPQLTGSNNWPNDIDEIVRLLKAADIELNQILFRHISTDQLPEVSKAKVNYVLCGEDFPYFDEKAESLGIKNWGQELVLPVGIHNTEEWYSCVAREFGDEKRARTQINEDMNLIRGICRLNYSASWMLTSFFGKRLAILGQASVAASLARSAFYDFNMQPVIVGLLSETPGGLVRAEKLLEPMSDFLDFQVLENPTYWLYGEKIGEAGVDFAIGSTHEEHLVEGLGIPHCSLTGLNFLNHAGLIPWPYFGIRGVLYLASELWRVTKRVLRQPHLWQMQSYRPRDIRHVDEVVSASG